eukprot:tig00021070_g17829.t1
MRGVAARRFLPSPTFPADFALDAAGSRRCVPVALVQPPLPAPAPPASRRKASGHPPAPPQGIGGISYRRRAGPQAGPMARRRVGPGRRGEPHLRSEGAAAAPGVVLRRGQARGEAPPVPPVPPQLAGGVGVGAPSGARWQSHSPTPSEAPSVNGWLPSAPGATPSVSPPPLHGGWRLPPSSVPRSAAAPIPRRASANGAASRAAACSPPDLTPPASWGGPGTAADGLAAALEAAGPRAFSPVDLSPRGDPGGRPSIGEALSAISPRRLPLASPPAPDVSALHACLAQLEGIAPAPAPRAPRVAPFKEAPSPAPAASPGLSASPFLSASEEERRAPSSGGAGGPSTSGGEEESLRAGSAFAPAAEEGEGDEAAPAPAAPPSRAARRKKKKGQ